MALTSDQIAEILGGLGQSRAGSALEKRRRAIRVKHRDVVQVVPYVEGVARVQRRAMLVDFSSRGVALRLALSIPAGSHLVLILPRDGRPPLRLLCEVVHCTPCPDGTYGIGAEYVGLAPTATAEPAYSVKAGSDEASRIAGSILD